MKNYLCKLILIFFVLTFFTNCKNKEIIFEGTTDNFINYYSKYEKEIKKNDLIEIEGDIAFIFLPKDGIKMNECAVYLSTANSNFIKPEGDFIVCIFNYRMDKEMVGKHLKVKGKYDKAYKDKSGIAIQLIKCVEMYD